MDEKQFREKLAEITALARNQQMCITGQQLKDAFSDIIKGEEQQTLLMEYLKSQKITVGEKADLDEFLSMEDKNYIEEYLLSLKEIPIMEREELCEVMLSATAGDVDSQQKVLEQFLPQVAELAKLYAGQGPFMEDLIGEGNLALAGSVTNLPCLEAQEDIWEEVSGFLGKAMMDAMEALINQDADEKEADEQMARLVNKVADVARELSEDLRRKVSVEEVCANSELTMDEVSEALRISGNLIDAIETE